MTFLYRNGDDDGSDDRARAVGSCDRAAVFQADGTVRVWDLDVEYRLGADPRVLCEIELGGGGVRCAASRGRGDRMAVVTYDGTVHVLTCRRESTGASISVDFTLESCHGPDGVSEVYFCPRGEYVYTLGSDGRDVYMWSAGE